MRYIFLAIFLCTVSFARADAGRTHLTLPQIERVKAVKDLLCEVDTKPLGQTIHDLEKTGHPLLNLQIREAMAKTYADIVKEHGVEGKNKKEWLYSMVTLNMAYLQFGGTQSPEPLNRMICRKLKENLPSDFINSPSFHYSLE